jgi:hypothetical protein
MQPQSCTSSILRRRPAVRVDRGPVHVEYAIDVAAPQQQVFTAVVDWDNQGDWMLGTKVSATSAGDIGELGRGLGATIAAFTGVGPVGFLDTMTITNWDEPHRVDVLHTGRIVKGTGTMIVERIDDRTARFVWSEDLHLPLGAIGRLGWPIVRPLFGRGIELSLRRFAQFVTSGSTS